ncbi:MAG TPA: hypothetical protein VFP50_19970, partial [Anaeromyxobacteraceae bacterium]|nr:hypothetical protein [Anaeromyxobacteraceae bacterium]
MRHARTAATLAAALAILAACAGGGSQSTPAGPPPPPPIDTGNPADVLFQGGVDHYNLAVQWG